MKFILDVAEIYQSHFLERGKLELVHLDLVSGKQELQKNWKLSSDTFCIYGEKVGDGDHTILNQRHKEEPTRGVQ